MRKIFLVSFLMVAGHAFSGGSTGGFPGLIKEELTLESLKFEKLATEAIANDTFVYKGQVLKPDIIRLHDQVKAMSFRSVDNPEEIIVIHQAVNSTFDSGNAPSVK